MLVCRAGRRDIRRCPTSPSHVMNGVNTNVCRTNREALQPSHFSTTGRRAVAEASPRAGQGGPPSDQKNRLWPHLGYSRVHLLPVTTPRAACDRGGRPQASTSSTLRRPDATAAVTPASTRAATPAQDLACRSATTSNIKSNDRMTAHSCIFILRGCCRQRADPSERADAAGLYPCATVAHDGRPGRPRGGFADRAPVRTTS